MKDATVYAEFDHANRHQSRRRLAMAGTALVILAVLAIVGIATADPAAHEPADRPSTVTTSVIDDLRLIAPARPFLTPDIAVR